MKTHRHRAATSEGPRPFWGPVGKRQNPAAHGGVMYRQACSCGAWQYVNQNGPHVERGGWFYAQEAMRPKDGAR